MKQLVILLSFSCLTPGLVWADGHRAVSASNFKSGVYSLTVLQGEIDDKSEAEHCAADAKMLVEEARSEKVELSGFSCQMGAQSGYMLYLYQKQ